MSELPQCDNCGAVMIYHVRNCTFCGGVFCVVCVKTHDCADHHRRAIDESIACLRRQAAPEHGHYMGTGKGGSSGDETK